MIYYFLNQLSKTNQNVSAATNLFLLYMIRLPDLLLCTVFTVSTSGLAKALTLFQELFQIIHVYSVNILIFHCVSLVLPVVGSVVPLFALVSRHVTNIGVVCFIQEDNIC